MYTASLIAGVLASVMVVVLSLLTSRKKIILFSIALCVTTGTQYALLGQYSTVVLSAITILYGVATFFEKHFPIIQSKGFLYGLLAVYTLSFFIANGFSLGADFMAYGASILGTVVMMLHNQISAKTVMLISGLLWLAFQLVVGAYGQIPGEIFYTAGCIYTLVVLFKRRNRAREAAAAETYDAKKDGITAQMPVDESSVAQDTGAAPTKQLPLVEQQSKLSEAI